MPEEPQQRRVDERDRARRRQTILTRVTAVLATALAGGFAGLAAEKASAHKAAPTSSTVTATTRKTTSIPAPPSLGVAPAPPAQAPLASPAPPVAVSGGS
jgi:type IV secretory pathway VirB10-like protein